VVSLLRLVISVRIAGGGMMTSDFCGPEYDYCDGCGDWKKIEVVVDNGNGFCRDCVEESLKEYHRWVQDE